jgi:hypothetical protein
MAFPATYNFNYYRGDSYEFIIYPKNANGTAFDLTSYNSNLFTVGTDRGTGGTLVGTGTVTKSGSTALICKITPTLGDLMSLSTYSYDVQINNTSASTKYTLLTGAITVTQDVTGRVV